MTEMTEKRRAFIEISGERSSGKTGLILSELAQATARREFCAVIDATDSFDPVSARNAGVDLNHILWICCTGKLDSALKAADYILHAGGFSHVVLDICDIRPEIVARIPRSYWFRFRFATEKSGAVFLLITPVPCSGAGSSAAVECVREKVEWSGSPEYRLLETVCARTLIRKAFRSAAMIKAGNRGITLEDILNSKHK